MSLTSQFNHVIVIYAKNVDNALGSKSQKVDWYDLDVDVLLTELSLVKVHQMSKKN